MHDLGENWPPLPDFDTVLNIKDVRIKTLRNLRQHLVSGRLDIFAHRHGLNSIDTGALAIAQGSRYCIRLARDRMLLVENLPGTAFDNGWHDEGYAVSEISAALHVFEIEGSGTEDLLSEALLINPEEAGASANVQFAGQMAVLYRHGKNDCLRLHVDRGLATYIWNWLERRV